MDVSLRRTAVGPMISSPRPRRWLVVALLLVTAPALIVAAPAQATMLPAQAKVPAVQAKVPAAQAMVPPAQEPTPIVPPPPVSGPHVTGDHTVAVFDYAKAIRESVRVNTKLDTDRDGKPDTVVVDIIRPAEAAAAGIKIPVIMVPSPYFTCCGRGDDGVKTYDSAGNLTKMPLFYDNYFVPRGYAVAALDLIGTGRSTGCGDVGGTTDVASATAAIDWLNGRNTATDLRGTAVTAGWTTGSVGLIGKSYDGTIANGAAATGIDGLRTIVPISAISSWYGYPRANGLVRWKTYLTGLGHSVGNKASVCDRLQAPMNAASEDGTGNYNDFWAARDYVKDAAKIRSSVFVVHGQEDLNVMPIQFGHWWDALTKNKVPRRLWLGRAEHTDPFDYRRAEWVSQLQSWFDYWLMGLPNAVMQAPMSEVEHEVGKWQVDDSWPPAPVREITLGKGVLAGAATGTVSLTDKAVTSEDAVVGKPGTAQGFRQVFLSAPVKEDVRVSGTPSVHLRLKVNKAQTPIAVKLVDYGRADRYAGTSKATPTSCWGGSISTDSACFAEHVTAVKPSDYGVIGRGWLSAQHRESLRQPTPLTAGQWVDLTVALMATDAVVRAGHQLGLVITLSDEMKMDGRSSGATVDIDLANSQLLLPTNQAAVITPATGVAPTTRLRPVQVSRQPQLLG